jgi:Glucose-6-phosphate dehydrogenase, C-terminal domain
VPVPVLTTALYERFASRGEADYQDKLLSAMRFGFGGHLEKTGGGRREDDLSHRSLPGKTAGSQHAVLPLCQYLESNYDRLRISPDVVLVFGFNVTSPVEESQSLLSELLASRHPCAREMDAYERVLSDAMAGDATLFVGEDYVEEAWRIVDPALNANTPVYEYEPNAWGPVEVERVTPPAVGTIRR